MSIIQHMQNLWLITRRNALQFQMFQNNERMLSALRDPMGFTGVCHFDNQLALDNARISTELAFINAQEKSLGKRLNILA